MLRAREIHQGDAALHVAALHEDATETRRGRWGIFLNRGGMDFHGFSKRIGLVWSSNFWEKWSWDDLKWFHEFHVLYLAFADVVYIFWGILEGCNAIINFDSSAGV